MRIDVLRLVGAIVVLGVALGSTRISVDNGIGSQSQVRLGGEIWRIVEYFLARVPEGGAEHFIEPIRLEKDDLVPRKLLNANIVFSNVVEVSVGAMVFRIPRDMHNIRVEHREAGVAISIALENPKCHIQIRSGDRRWRLPEIMDMSEIEAVSLAIAGKAGVDPKRLKANVVAEFSSAIGMHGSELSIAKKSLHVTASDVVASEELEDAVISAATLIARDNMFGLCEGGVVREIERHDVVMLVGVHGTIGPGGETVVYSCQMFEPVFGELLAYVTVGIPREAGYGLDDVSVMLDHLVSRGEE